MVTGISVRFGKTALIKAGEAARSEGNEHTSLANPAAVCCSLTVQVGGGWQGAPLVLATPHLYLLPPATPALALKPSAQV